LIEELLRAALDDAGIFEDTAILFIITGEPPVGAVEYAYLPPGAWGNLMNRVLYDAGLRIHEFNCLHRFATYSELPDAPEAGIAAGFRHEAQHAVHFNEYGHGLFNLESVLRLAMRRRDQMGDYHLIPTERDANRAAGTYVGANYADQVDLLAVDDRFRHFVENPQPVVDLLDETVETVWQYAEPDEIDEEDDEQRPFGVVVPELRDAAVAWTPIDPQYRVRRPDGEAFAIEIPA
jgi:hypothetical protein